MEAPATSSSPLRTLFLLEATGNVLGGTAALFFPRTTLRFLTHPTLTFPLTNTNEPSAASVQLLQWIGALIYALAVPLYLGAPQTARAKASRRIVYQTLGSGEIFLIAVMLWQLQGADTEGAITKRVLLISSAVLGVTVLGRGWILGFKNEWFEDDTVSTHKRRTSNR